MGSIIGVLLGAVLVDRFGYKWSILGNLAFMTPLIGLITFAPNKGALLAGELLCGIPWGVFSTLAEAYASEVCPLSLRGYLTTYVKLDYAFHHELMVQVHQPVLGHWTLDRCRYSQESSTNDWHLVFPNAIRCSMGLAGPSLPHPPFRSGIAMVASPKRQDRTSPYLCSTTHSICYQGTIKGDCIIHDPNQSA
jgi:hypothetical protein